MTSFGQIILRSGYYKVNLSQPPHFRMSASMGKEVREDSNLNRTKSPDVF